MDAILKFSENEHGVLQMEGLHQGEFKPQQIKSHAMLDAVRKNWDELNATVHGLFSDGDRFRALKEFGLLHANDKARFELINGQLQAFEEKNIGEEGPTTDAEYVRMADFLIQALRQSEPVIPALVPALALPELTKPE